MRTPTLPDICKGGGPFTCINEDSSIHVATCCISVTLTMEGLLFFPGRHLETKGQLAGSTMRLSSSRRFVLEIHCNLSGLVCRYAVCPTELEETSPSAGRGTGDSAADSCCAGLLGPGVSFPGDTMGVSQSRVRLLGSTCLPSILLQKRVKNTSCHSENEEWNRRASVQVCVI